MVNVVTPTASSPIHQCIAAQCSVHCSAVSALQFAKNQGREYIGVGPVSTAPWPIWMRTGTSPCTDLSPSFGCGHTY